VERRKDHSSNCLIAGRRKASVVPEKVCDASLARCPEDAGGLCHVRIRRSPRGTRSPRLEVISRSGASIPRAELPRSLECMCRQVAVRRPVGQTAQIQSWPQTRPGVVWVNRRQGANTQPSWSRNWTATPSGGGWKRPRSGASDAGCPRQLPHLILIAR
jgi:hypothetical protein